MLHKIVLKINNYHHLKCLYLNKHEFRDKLHYLEDMNF